MKTNVGGNDRNARLVLGPLLIIAAAVLYFEVLTVTGLLGAGLVVAGLLVGAILLVTGAFGYCPINAVLGRDTARAADAPAQAVESESPPESEMGRAH